MKIKIIDLLIKIAKEEAPKKIMYQNKIWNYCKDTQDYTDGTSYLIADSVDYIYKPKFLNAEVEIIEEEKEIEKIRMNGNCFFSESIEAWINKEKSSAYCEFLSNKINELVDEINKLKQCKKEVIEGYRVGKVITYNGFEWYIIEEKKESIVLFMKEKLSEELIYDVRFSKDEKNNDWKDSHIRQVLNTKFLEKFITGDLVLMKTKYDDDKTSDDYIRLITIDELKKLDSNIRKVKCNYGYWTMSPGNFNSGLAEVYEFYLSGTYIAIYSSLVTGRSGVRPIIEVRKNAIGG